MKLKVKNMLLRFGTATKLLGIVYYTQLKYISIMSHVNSKYFHKSNLFNPHNNPVR